MKNLGKKLLLTFMATSLVATSVIGLTACNKPNTAKADAKDMFSMAAVSSVAYLGQGASATATAETNAPATARPADITDETVTSLKTYLGMFNDMLANGGFKTETGDLNADETAKYGDYKSKIVVTVKGEKYAIYYNETAESGKDVDPDDDDDEIEEKTSLEGILVKGEDKFDVTGGREIEKEVEDEGTEEEHKIWFETTNENGTVLVEQEHEFNAETGEEETSYKYTIKDANGDKVTEYEVEWEIEGKKTEMEVSITDKNGVETEYEVEAISNTELVITKEVEQGESETENEIKVTKLSDTEYKFVYANGFSETVTLD